MVSTTAFRSFSAGSMKRKSGFAGHCWVYIICWRQRGPCKIGVANTPHDRLAGLQTANPFKLHIWRAYGFANGSIAFEIEGLALGRLHGVRMEGEWVNATVKQTEEVIMAICAGRGLRPIPYRKADYKAKQAANRVHRMLLRGTGTRFGRAAQEYRSLMNFNKK